MSGVGRVIVGTSGSPGSLHALRYGERMARAHDAIVIPVLAWELPGGDHAERVQPSGELRQAWQSRMVFADFDAPAAIASGAEVVLADELAHAEAEAVRQLVARLRASAQGLPTGCLWSRPDRMDLVRVRPTPPPWVHLVS